MKPNDKAYAAAIKIYNIHSDYDAESVSLRLAVDAAFAAQFQSEDYAGLVKWLRDKAESLSEIYPPEAEAADALEAVLAERDALKGLVKIYEKKLIGIEDEIKLAVQSAIAAIRPHIEAAERERCAKAVEKVAERINVPLHERPAYEDGYLQGVHDAAAAIRSGK